METGLQYSGNRFTVQWKQVYSTVETGLQYSGNRFTVQWKQVYSTVETGLQYSGNQFTVEWKPVPDSGENITAPLPLDLLHQDGENHVEAGPEGAEPKPEMEL